MKKTVLTITILLLFLLLGFSIIKITLSDNKGVFDSDESGPGLISDQFQNGDIIFQESKSSQSKAIQLATNSRYSHMGIIYITRWNHYGI